jgi:hypothetical protein
MVSDGTTASPGSRADHHLKKSTIPRGIADKTNNAPFDHNDLLLPRAGRPLSRRPRSHHLIGLSIFSVFEQGRKRGTARPGQYFWMLA